MSFSFKHYVRFAYVALFKAGSVRWRGLGRRLIWLFAFYTLFPLLEVLIRLGFWLDEVLFPAYRAAQVTAPVFIVGNPRSGTTFLHRLLAQDRQHFTWMQTWEILLAPSITQRKLVRAVMALDARLGGPLHQLIAAGQRRWQRANVMHKIALRAPEEDEHLLLHIWSTVLVWTYAGLLGEIDDWVHFDTAIPAPERRRIMDFYLACLRRHQYVRGGGGRHYLAKNPNFSPKIDTLYEVFPDARIIYLARNPLDMVPSFISILQFEWEIFGSPWLGHPSAAASSYAPILDLAEHWYKYPLERLAQAPAESYVIVNFDAMVQNPDRTVREIYDHFGLEVSPAYAEVLRQATLASQAYESDHEYALEEMGLTREELVARFAPVFRRFGFSTRAPDPGGEER
jgi:hypothetical protein